jgi:ATP-binding cassette subfamily B protein
MATLLASRTTFVIAHWLSTIRRADLLLMEDGRIIERGTHEQLMCAVDDLYSWQEPAPPQRPRRLPAGTSY